MSEVLSYLQEKVGWVRPKDTGRSTNCLINDTGIYVHKRQRGYHNYALPYSWDVRLGHKTREAAIDELRDRIDIEQVQATLKQIGYDSEVLASADEDRTMLSAYYVASREIPDEEIREQLSNRLPAQLIPTHLQRLEALPLTHHGKIDLDALPHSTAERHRPDRFEAPEGPVQEYLADIWQQELGVKRVGLNDHFFELGGTSLIAMRVMVQLCREFVIDLPLETLFNQPRLADLSRVAEDRILGEDQL